MSDDRVETFSERGNERTVIYLWRLSGGQERHDLMDRAVEADPHWEKLDDGSYQCSLGAIHETPEALISAYRRNSGDAE